MTSKELIKIIEDENLKPFFISEDWYLLTEECVTDCGSYRTEEDLFESHEKAEKFLDEKFGEFEHLDSREDTSEFWTIVYFKKHNIYIKFIGDFNSYDMVDHRYDTKPIEVFPKTITKIIYQ